MTYLEMLEKLNGLGRFGMKLTLDRITALLDLLGHPERRLRAVHVAGTNGKGSTVAMLGAIMRAAGYRTGHWISPHLEDFCERVALDGRAAAPELFVQAFERVWPAVERIKDGPGGHPTQFEIGTAMAFLILAEAEPDLALIETGLGGRYDSTNVINPLVSVITHLDLDHVDRLGPDLASIAAEKAGIIKPGRPVVTAPQRPEAMAVLAREAARLGAPLRAVGRDLRHRLLEATPHGTFCELSGATDYGRVRVNLLGAHQVENAATAVAAAESLAGLGYTIPSGAIRAGLDAVVWPGRLEVVGRDPWVVLDGAHNPDGLRALTRALREVFHREKADFLLVFRANRPLAEMVGIIAPLARRVVATDVSGGTAPGVAPDLVARAFAGSAIAEPDPARALRLALEGLPADGLLCVCGSLHLVGAVRGIMMKRAKPGPTAP